MKSNEGHPTTCGPRPRRYALATALAALAFAALVAWSPAATINVNTTVDEEDGSIVDGDVSIRDALARANDGDVIRIPAGTYLIGLGREFETSKSLTLIGAGADKTYLKGHPVPYDSSGKRLFSVSEASANVGFEDMAFLNGYGNSYGGAIDVDASSVTVKRCEFWRNSAGSGAAIAVRNVARLYASYCDFYENLSSPGTVFFGDSYASGEIRMCRFERNSYTPIHANDPQSSVTILDSILTNNRGPQGMVYLGGASVSLNRCLISCNHEGPGLFNGGGSLNVSNTTITRNFYSGPGSGIYHSGGSAIVRGCTIVENLTGGNGGGIYAAGPGFSIGNTIVARNMDGSSGKFPDTYGQFSSAGNNLIGILGEATSGITNGVNGDQAGTASLPLDPMLGPLADNGGFSMTYALLPGSPAIDAGGGAIEPTDQRGVARPLDGDGNGSAVQDIGAYEAGAVDLSVLKLLAPETVYAGTTVTYTVVVTNRSFDTAVDVELVDNLPAEVTYVSSSASQGSCSEAGGVVTCQLGDLTGQKSAVAQITVLVDSDASGTVTNQATVSAGSPESDSGDNSTSLDAVITGAGRLSVDPSHIVFGDRQVGDASTSPTVVRLRNDGVLPIGFTGSSVTLGGADPGDFTAALASTGPLNPGVGRDLDVDFVPGSAGLKTAYVRIESDDPVNPVHIVPLYGGGVEGDPVLLRLIDYLLGRATLTPGEKAEADYNGDGVIDIADVVYAQENPVVAGPLTAGEVAAILQTVQEALAELE